MNDPEFYVEHCGCNALAHYNDPVIEAFVRGVIAEKGPVQHVVTPDGSFGVPRHYVALHGVRGEEVSGLALDYEWPHVD